MGRWAQFRFRDQSNRKVNLGLGRKILSIFIFDAGGREVAASRAPPADEVPDPSPFSGGGGGGVPG